MQADPGSSGNLVLRQAPGGGTEHTIQVDQDGQIVGGDGGTHTITFTDGEGNLITSVVGSGSAAGAIGAGETLNLSGVTVVPSDALGPHFLSPVTLDGVSLKLEAVGPGDQLVSPIVLTGDPTGVNQQPQQVEVLVASPTKFETAVGKPAGAAQKPKTSGPESEKKICLWPTGNGTTCGKAFAKFDSLKRHLTEAHKGVRPFACKLCDKTYGRRDYLQRHLKSHNASYAVNLAGGNAATLQSYNAAAKAVKIEMENQQNNSQNQTGGQVGLGPNQGGGGNQTTSVASMPLLNLYSIHNAGAAPKPLGSKICRWVQDDGTVCGKAFSKLDSLRRHVNELHKGVRPFACTRCDKNYGRKDYLDRHVKTHEPGAQKRKPAEPLDWGSSTGVVNLLNSIKEDPKPKNPDAVKKKRRDIPAEEKKICLWVLDDGTACGKTFTKFDSLKRHVSEGHKNVRPFCCTLCGKTYGRRDYLLRHLRSHNETDLANLAVSAQLKEAAAEAQMGQVVSSPDGSTSILVTSGGGSSNNSSGLLGGLSANSSPIKSSSAAGGLSQTQVIHANQEIGQVINSLSSSPTNDQPIQVLTSSGNIVTTNKGLVGGGPATILGTKVGGKRSNDKKTCRWVLDNGTICGRNFSKFDSLRRHVQELHKGVRPFACNLCDKTYGRKDYLERHIKSHSTKETAVVTAEGAKLMTAHEVLTSGAVMLGDDDEDMDMMGGDVVTVVGAVDDEDDDLTV